MPPAKKPPAKRKRRNADTLEKQAAANKGRLALVGPGRVSPPPLPASGPQAFLKVTREWWQAFWSQSELQLGLGDIDVHMVRRLASLMDQRERAWRSVRRAPLVDGSMGQPVENPLAKRVQACDAEIRQLEDRLGLSPRARLSLGVTFGQAKSSLEDLTRPAMVDEETAGADLDSGPQVVEV